jgi:hypothetical protein
MPKPVAGSLRETQTETDATHASEGDAVANEITKLTSVEGLSGTVDGASGVFVVEREVEREVQPDASRWARAVGIPKKAKRAMNPLLEQVTLVVYGWQSVEPGTLSWVFPSVGAAVAAARAMKNAVKWAIVAGKRENDVEEESDDGAADSALEEARARGKVLVEQAG